MKANKIIPLEITTKELRILEAISTYEGYDKKIGKRAKAILAYGRATDEKIAAKESDLTVQTFRKVLDSYKKSGWQALITVQAPRGGDFLARYDQGFWAEKLTRRYLDASKSHRAVPYGTSRSKPFSDMKLFREYTINEMMLQSWSEGTRWKRPDLIMLPRQALAGKRSNANWIPDLIHRGNPYCKSYIELASAAIEVETSLWLASQATVSLSFTVKDEDLEALRSWVSLHKKPLYIIQVFYDQAHVLSFSRLEYLIGSQADDNERVLPKVDRVTNKNTYMVPLRNGYKLGDISKPKVKGRIFKADNGKITVYAQLMGSDIAIHNHDVLDQIANGTLK